VFCNLDYDSCLCHKGKPNWLLIYKTGYEVGRESR